MEPTDTPTTDALIGAEGSEAVAAENAGQMRCQDCGQYMTGERCANCGGEPDEASLPLVLEIAGPVLPLGHHDYAMMPEVRGQVASVEKRLLELANGGILPAVPSSAEIPMRRVKADMAAVAQSRESAGVDEVAVIPLAGLITPRGSFLAMLFGGRRGGLEAFREDFREAMNDDAVGAIVLDVDSPGGLVSLVAETAAEVNAARGQGKKIVACCNTLCASAAYWIASQADEVVVTPSGKVGSIGVYTTHVDCSGLNERMGLDPTYISAGKYKTEGNEDSPLSAEAKAAIQREIDDIYAMFVDGVAQGRGTSPKAVEDGYGQGRVLGAQRGVEASLADRVATIQQTVGGLLGVAETEVEETEEREPDPSEEDGPETASHRAAVADLLLG